MSQAVQADRMRSGTLSGTVANTAAAAEIVLRGAVGTVSVRAIAGAVRDHPMLSLLLATGIGYLIGFGRRPREERPNDAREERPNDG